MRNVLSICNQALGAAGARAALTSIDDNTLEAEKCRLFYETARDEVFSAAPWSSLSATARLTEVVRRDPSVDWEATDPAPGWGFAHRLPINFHYPRHLSNWSAFNLGRVGEEVVLLSNSEHPILTYTRKVEDPQAWETMLYSLVIAWLGVKLAMALRVDDKAYKRAVENFQSIYSSALTISANQDIQVIPETLPDWIEARGFVSLTAPVRYFYPTQALLYGPNQTFV